MFQVFEKRYPNVAKKVNEIELDIWLTVAQIEIRWAGYWKGIHTSEQDRFLHLIKDHKDEIPDVLSSGTEMVNFIRWMEEIGVRHRVNSGLISGLHFGLTTSDVLDLARGLVAQKEWKNLRTKIQEMKPKKEAKVFLPVDTHGQPTHRPFILLSEAFSSGWNLPEPIILVGDPGPTGQSPIKDEWFSFLEVYQIPFKKVDGKHQALPRSVFWGHLLQPFVSLSSLLADFSEKIWYSIAKGWVKIEEERHTTSSSSMPHKQNPTPLERVIGISRFVHSAFSSLTSQTHYLSWRDVSHNWTERLMFPLLLASVEKQIFTLSEILGALQQNILPSRDKDQDSFTLTMEKQRRGMKYSEARK